MPVLLRQTQCHTCNAYLERTKEQHAMLMSGTKHSKELKPIASVHNAAPLLAIYCQTCCQFDIPHDYKTNAQQYKSLQPLAGAHAPIKWGKRVSNISICYSALNAAFWLDRPGCLHCIKFACYVFSTCKSSLTQLEWFSAFVPLGYIEYSIFVSWVLEYSVLHPGTHRILCLCILEHLEYSIFVSWALRLLICILGYLHLSVVNSMPAQGCMYMQATSMLMFL